MPSTDLSRYRIEDGLPTVDVQLAAIERLFDNRDPAPFRERDLDPTLFEYLYDAAEDLSSTDELRLVFWLAEPARAGEVEAAVRSHLGYELDRRSRQRRRHVGVGLVALAIAVASMVALVVAGELVARALTGTIGTALREGLVISGWVLMWRPIEVLVYDGVPWRRERRLLRRLQAAPIDVRHGAGPRGVA